MRHSGKNINTNSRDWKDAQIIFDRNVEYMTQVAHYWNRCYENMPIVFRRSHLFDASAKHKKFEATHKKIGKALRVSDAQSIASTVQDINRQGS